MLMSCTYYHNGQRYTRTGLLKAIKSGTITIPKLDDANARKYLNDVLGLNDSQVEIVKGMIDGNSYGRFLADGRILLSDQLEGSQYHEAFHRVWRMLLTDNERNGILSEFAKRNDAEHIINGMRERYPEADRNTLIEEALAEEFMYYTLSNGRYNVPEPPVKNFFDWLVGLFRKLFNLSTRELYDRINAGGYRSRIPRSYIDGSADMLELNSKDDNGNFVQLNVRFKNEILEDIFGSILTTIRNSNQLYDFVEKKLTDKTMGDLFATAVNDLINHPEYGLLNPPEDFSEGDKKRDIELGMAILDDVFGEDESVALVKRDSQLFRAFKEYAHQVGLKLSMSEVETPKEEDIDDPETEDEQVGDNAFSHVSMEFDPRGNMSSAVKLFMASIPSDKLSQELQLATTVPYAYATKTVYELLAGVPKDLDIIVSVLNAAKADHPWMKEITHFLKGNSEEHMRFRSEFVAAFANNKYRFVQTKIRDGEYRLINIGEDSQKDKYFQYFDNRMQNRWANNRSGLIAALKSNDLAIVARALGLDEVVEMNLFDEAIPTTVWKIGERVSIIANEVIASLEAGVPIYDLYHERKENNVKGFLRTIGTAIAEKGLPFELLILNGENKRIYTISKHTYQTIMIGTLNYIAQDIGSKYEGDHIRMKEEGIKLIKKLAPHLLHADNYDVSTGEVRSKWLASILKGLPLQLHIIDSMTTRQGATHFSKVDTTDYLANYVNSVLQGRYIGFKHGDRKVIYGYEPNKGINEILSFNREGIIHKVASLAIPYLTDEVRRISMFNERGKDPMLGYGLTHVENHGDKLWLFDFMASDLKTMLKTFKKEGTEGLDRFIKNNLRDKLGKFFDEQGKHLANKMQEQGLWREAQVRGKNAGYPVGIEKSIWEQAMKENRNNVNDTRNALATVVAGKYFFGFIEQMKLFNGEPYNYKSFIEFYKRAQMQSSTGTSFLTGAVIEDYLSSLNTRDSFTIDGEQRVYGVGDHKRAGYQSEIVLFEQKYTPIMAYDTGFTSPIDGSDVSMAQFIIETGTINELESRLGTEEAKRIARERALVSIEAMSAYDENDGTGWINMFFWREYMLKTGKWNDEKENTFQIELAVIDAMEKGIPTSQVQVWTDGTSISAKEKVGWSKVTVFDTASVNEALGITDDRWLIKRTDYATILKPQYTGPFMPVDPIGVADDAPRLNLIAGRKTAYVPLLPSAIRGTKLELMNKMMLKGGIDTVHMRSAAKYGTKNKGVFAPESASFLYDTKGMFNPEIEENLDGLVSWLDLAYQKDQVNVGTTPKEEIRNATQSVKTMLENMLVEGIPIDTTREAFEAAEDEEARRALSPVYNVYADYRDNLHAFIVSAIDRVDKEMDGMDRIAKVLLSAAKDRAEPRFIMESIQTFINDKRLETLPNSRRIESLLYSIVTNGAIKLYRPGDGKPQMTTSLWEDVKTNREVLDDGRITTRNQVTTFYGLDEEGNLTPAKTIMPIRADQQAMLMRMFKTTNIIEAIEMYNSLSDQEKMDKGFIVKSLRIPNQQFSFNAVMLIDRFVSPLMQQFVGVPSEFVPTTDSDFDLDKQQIYEYARLKDGSIPMPEKLDDNSDEAVSKRMSVWMKLDRLDLPTRDVVYQEDATYYQWRDQLRKELRTLKRINSELRDRYDLADEDSFINKFHAEEIKRISDFYGIPATTIGELLDGLRDSIEELTTSASNGSGQERREAIDGEALQILYDARKEVFDLFDAERAQREQIRELREEGYRQLEAINEDIRQLEIDAFRELYPTPLAQTHRLVLHNALLQSEIKLLLSKHNAHKMLASTDDSFLSRDLFAEIVSLETGAKKEDILKAENYEEHMLGKMNSASFMGVAENAERAVRMIAAKANVGPVANAITHHNVMMADGLNLRETFQQEDTDKHGNPILKTVSSLMPIDGFQESLAFSDLISVDGRFVLEVLSVLLTSQVDGVNKPYAPRMNFVDETLPIILMMTRRGVDIGTIAYLINNPLVKDWVAYKLRNSSAVFKAGRLTKSRDKVITQFLKERGVLSSYQRYYNAYVQGSHGEIVNKDALRDRIGKTSTSNDDVKALAAFMILNDQADSLFTVSAVLTPDTKGKRNRVHVVDFQKRLADAQRLAIVETGYREGFLSKFYDAQELYDRKLKDFYKLDHKRLDAIGERYASWRRSDDHRERIRQRVQQDFVTYLLQNYSSLRKVGADKTVLGSDTMVHEIVRRKEEMTDENYNYALDMLVAKLAIDTDPRSEQLISNLQIADRGAVNTSFNDMYDDFQMLDDDTQEKLIASTIRQAGMTTTPYMLSEMIDVKRLKVYLDEAFKAYEALSTNEEEMDRMMANFEVLWALNNPDLLPYSARIANRSKIRFYAERNEGNRFYTIRYAANKQAVPTLGSIFPAIRRFEDDQDGLPAGEVVDPDQPMPEAPMPAEDITVPSNVKGENISSRGSDFAKQLTNPGNNLKVEYRGKVFRNAEHAYQTWKSGEFDETAYKSTAFKPKGSKQADRLGNYHTMVNILITKLQQHPHLVKGIQDRGGLGYLQASTHNVTGDKFWESSGENGFIRALSEAYKFITNAQPGTYVLTDLNRVDSSRIEKIDDQLRRTYSKAYTAFINSKPSVNYSSEEEAFNAQEKLKKEFEQKNPEMAENRRAQIAITQIKGVQMMPNIDPLYLHDVYMEFKDVIEKYDLLPNKTQITITDTGSNTETQEDVTCPKLK